MATSKVMRVRMPEGMLAAMMSRRVKVGDEYDQLITWYMDDITPLLRDETQRRELHKLMEDEITRISNDQSNLDSVKERGAWPRDYISYPMMCHVNERRLSEARAALRVVDEWTPTAQPGEGAPES